MRNSTFTIFLIVAGFVIPIVALPALRQLQEAHEKSLDIDPQRGEVLFFTADW